MAKPRKQPSLRIDYHPSVAALNEKTKSALRKLTLKDGLMRPILKESVPQRHTPACIAIERKEIVGWACLSKDLLCVYVHSKARRRGIGSQLVRAIHASTKSKKKVLQAYAHSTAGNRLYLKMRQELPLRVNYIAPTRSAPFR